MSGLIELLCKSEVSDAVDPNASAATLTQVGSTLIETAPWGIGVRVRRRNHIAQTTVEDAMNLIHRYSNSIHSTDPTHYTHFYCLLLKLYAEMPSVRTRVLQILAEKLRVLVQRQDTLSSTQTLPVSELLQLDSVCANGSIQQPVHDIIAAVALVLHPMSALPAAHVSEGQKQKLAEWALARGVRGSLFNLFLEKLVQAEVEEFKLDKSASFNPAESEGKTNLAKRYVLSSLYMTAVYVRTAALLQMSGNSQTLQPVRVLTLGQITTLLNNIIVRACEGCDAQKMNHLVGEKVKDPFAGQLVGIPTTKPALLNLLHIFIDMVGVRGGSEG